MKRWFWASVILLGGIASLARADYIIIVADLGLSKDQTPGTEGQPGAPGFNPGAIAAGGPRGGAGGGPPGMSPPGGGAPGAIGAAGGGGPRGGANPGVAGGGGPRGGTGSPDGAPPGAFPGGFPGEGGFGAEPIESSPFRVIAVVEITGRGRGLVDGLVAVKHKWGTTNVFPNDPSGMIKIIPLMKDGKPWSSVAKRFEDKKKEAHKDKTPNAAALLKLAEWALEKALIPEFEKTMDELAALESEKDHPLVKAYKKIKDDMAKPLAPNPNAAMWQKDLLRSYKGADSTEGHYTLFFEKDKSNMDDVLRRLGRLESTFKGFYYWFALKGKVLTVPSQRLVAVLVPEQSEFERHHLIFDSVPLVADGFFARRENLAVFSQTRLDPGYDALVQRLQPVWPSLGSKEKLLQGKYSARIQSLDQVAEVSRAQTLTLLMRALEEDSEIATVTHEGTRQLLAAAGMPAGTATLPLLQRNVGAPQWVQFGMGSFFETPKSSAWLSVGMPTLTLDEQYNYLSQFKKWAKNKKNDAKAALEGVVGDQFFREAAALKPQLQVLKDKEKKDDAEKAKERDLEQKERDAVSKARSLSWSLTHFLAQRKLDGLLRYFQELNKLPRDMEFDSEALVRCFGKAFDLIDVAKPDKLDAAKVAKFTNEWLDAMNLLSVEGEEYLKEVQKKHELRPSTNPAGTLPGLPGTGGPASPGQPGGAPGGLPGGLPPGGRPGQSGY